MLGGVNNVTRETTVLDINLVDCACIPLPFKQKKMHSGEDQEWW